MAKMNIVKGCRRRGCRKPAAVTGLCWMHYQRQRRAKKKAS